MQLCGCPWERCRWSLEWEFEWLDRRWTWQWLKCVCWWPGGQNRLHRVAVMMNLNPSNHPVHWNWTNIREHFTKWRETFGTFQSGPPKICRDYFRPKCNRLLSDWNQKSMPNYVNWNPSDWNNITEFRELLDSFSQNPTETFWTFLKKRLSNNPTFL